MKDPMYFSKKDGKESKSKYFISNDVKHYYLNLLNKKYKIISIDIHPKRIMILELKNGERITCEGVAKL